MSQKQSDHFPGKQNHRSYKYEISPFIIPLKKGCVDQYKSILKKAVRRKREYSDCLRHYDLRNAKAWVKSLDGKDYAYIYHDVCENFQ